MRRNEDISADVEPMKTETITAPMMRLDSDRFMSGSFPRNWYTHGPPATGAQEVAIVVIGRLRPGFNPISPPPHPAFAFDLRKAAA